MSAKTLSHPAPALPRPIAMLIGGRSAFLLALAAAFLLAARAAGAPYSGGRWQLDWIDGDPDGRGRGAMVYLPSLTQTMLFGGDSYSGITVFRTNDTLTYDGTWQTLSPSTRPPARRDFAMALDPATNRAVLFGGRTTEAATSDTWEWDGTSWAERAVTGTAPSARVRHAMATLAGTGTNHGTVVLFGGHTGTQANDTYIYSGGNWTRITGTAPAAREACAMAYDGTLNALILFGGGAGVAPALTAFSDTWKFDGVSWSQLTPTASPPAAVGHSMATEPVTGRPLLFAGYRTWVYRSDAGSQGTWVELASTDGAPNTRGAAQMTADEQNDRIILFGGIQCSAVDQTWLFSTVAPAAPTITYSKASKLYGVPNVVRITATFDQDVAPLAPSITITGGTVGGTFVNGRAMTQGADRRTWTFAQQVSATDASGHRNIAIAALNSMGIAMPASGDGGFDLDTVPPQLSSLVYSKASRLYGSGQPFALTATFSELLAPSPGITITGGFIGGSAVTNQPMTQGASAATWSFTRTISSADPTAARSVTMRGMDLADNPSTVTPPLHFQVDTIPPSVALSYNRSTALYKGGDLLTIWALFSEDITPSAPSIAFDAGVGGVLGATLESAGDRRQWSFSTTVRTTDPTAARLATVTGQDAAGNSNTPATGASFEIDTTPPSGTIAFGKTPPIYGLGQQVVLTATFDEDAAGTPSIHIGNGIVGGGPIAGAPMTQAGNAKRWTYSLAMQAGDTDGSHPVTVTALDAAGNSGRATGSFTSDVTAPTVSTSFDKDSKLYGLSDTLFITAIYSEPIFPSAPMISIDGGTIGGATISDAAMSPDGDLLHWTFKQPLAAADGDGGRNVAIEAADEAGNEVATADSFDVDVTAPTVSLVYSRTSRLYGGQDTFAVTATFSEEITPDAPAIEIGGGTVGGTAVSSEPMTPGTNARVWTFSQPLAASDADGSRAITVTGADAAGNTNAATPDGQFDIDTSRPSVTLTYSKPSRLYGRSDTLLLTATFSEEITPDAPAIEIAGGTVGGTTITTEAMTPGANRATWTFSRPIDAADSDGSRTIAIAAADAAGNASTAPANATFDIDTSRPSVTLTYSKPSRLYGRSDTLLLTASFSEEITPDAPAIEIGGGTVGATTITTEAMTPGADRATWTFSRPIDAADSDGSRTITVTAADAAGNASTAPVNATFDIDTSRPSVTLTYSKPSRLYGRSDTLLLTASFSEEITPDAPAIEIGGGTVGATTITTEAMTPGADRATWTFSRPIDAADPDGSRTITVTAADAAGNASTAPVNATFDIDTSPLSVTLTYSKPSRLYGRSDTLLLTASFSEEITPDAPAIEIGGGTVGATTITTEAMTPGADRATWTFSKPIDAADADGSRTIAIAAADAAGNASTAPADATFDIDTSRPSVTLTYSKPSRLYGRSDTLLLTASFSEEITPDVPAIEIAGGPLGGATVSGVAMTPGAGRSHWTFSRTLSSADSSGARAVSIRATDAASNTAEAATNASFALDTAPPAVTVAYSKLSRLYGLADTVALTATFSEDVTPAAPTLSIAGGIVGGSAVTSEPMTLQTDRRHWSFVRRIAPADASGVRDATVLGRDAAGNAGASTSSFSLDTVAPAVTLSYSKDAAAVTTGPLLITASFSEPLSSTPSIAIDRPGSVNDVASTPMTATVNLAAWSFVYLVAEKDDVSILDGATRVSVSGGKDAAGNSSLPAANSTIVVVSPARLSIVTIATGPLVVSRGQRIDGVAMSVSNTGGATAHVTEAYLTFDGGRTGYLANAASFPGSISAGSSATFVFDVAVGAEAPLGPAVLDGHIRATDHNDAAHVTGDDSAQTPDSWTVVDRASLQAVSIGSVPFVERGQSVRVTLAVTNTGGAAADQLAASLRFSSSGSDVTSCYGVAANPANPTKLVSHTATVLDFSVGISTTAPLSRTTLTATVDGIDENSGEATSASGLLLTTWWTVQEPAALVFGPVRAPQAVLRGAEFLVDVPLRNTGEADAGQVRLDMVWSGRDLSPLTGVADVLEGSSSVTATFQGFVPLDSAVASVPGTATVRWRDTVSGASTSLATGLTIRVLNNPPTARFTGEPSGLVTTAASFDASSSFDGPAADDSEGDALSYHWTLSERPGSSAASFTPNDSPAARVTRLAADRKGLYAIGLTVHDGHDASPLTTQAFTILNSPPVASAGPAVTVTLGARVELSGSGADPNVEDSLLYTWSFVTRPAGSRLGDSAFSSNGTTASARTSFLPDAAGSYVVALVAGDGASSSASSTTAVLVTPGLPVSVAAASTTTRAPGAVVLDGTASTGTGPLTYRWRLLSQPAGSAAVFSNNDSPDAGWTSLSIDRKGLYAVSLVVSDSVGSSAPSTLAVAGLNSRPVAVIANARDGTTSGPAGEVFALDGTPSTDPNPEDSASLTHAWSQVSGAPVTLSNPNGSVTTFWGGEGTYVFSLVVSDGTDESLPATVSIRLSGPPNGEPTARIDVDTLGGPPRTIRLDASASSDPELQPLSYAWSLLSAPEGAAPFVSNEVAPSYRALAAGTYTFVLSVFDPRLAVGTAQVSVTVDDLPPVANAGEQAWLYLANPLAPPTIPTTLSIVLDGTASWDPNGTPVICSWHVLVAPDTGDGRTDPTTLATISALDSACSLLEFRADALGGVSGAPLAAAGRYVVELTASSDLVSSTATVEIVAHDPAALLPVADAGFDRHYAVDVDPSELAAGSVLFPDPLEPPDSQARRPAIRLDGRRSRDAGVPPLPLSYAWSVVSRPAGSPSIALSDPTSSTAAFVPLAAGPYRFRLLVANARFQSLPDEVTIAVTNLRQNSPPSALIRVSGARSAGEYRGRPYFSAGPSALVTFSATGSVDRDLADRDRLTYAWTAFDVAGRPLEAQRSAGSGPGFVLQMSPGFLARVQLLATDPRGETGSAEIWIGAPAVGPAGNPLSIVSSASTTSETGEGFLNLAFPGTGVRTLRVWLPSQVTMTAEFGASLAGDESYDFTWRQLRGPTVLLTALGESDTTVRQSLTSFTPTTSGVLLFQFDAAQRLRGDRTGFVYSAYVWIVVLSPTWAAPTPGGLVLPPEVPIDGSDTQRTIWLNGLSSSLLSPAPGSYLVFYWRQIAGPPGVFDDPGSITTTFHAPPVSGASGEQSYVFELIVIQQPQGAQSEPLYFEVVQRSPAEVVLREGLVQLYISNRALASAPGQLAADGSGSIPGVVIPAGTPSGTVMTLEALNPDGTRRQPPLVLRTFVLQLAAGGATGLVLAESGVLVLDPSILGSVRTAVVVAPAASPAGALAGPPGGGGGGGCVLDRGNGTSLPWLEGLWWLAVLVACGLVGRHARRI